MTSSQEDEVNAAHFTLLKKLFKSYIANIAPFLS